LVSFKHDIDKKTQEPKTAVVTAALLQRMPNGPEALQEFESFEDKESVASAKTVPEESKTPEAV